MNTSESIKKALTWRYATKQFDPTKKIDDETIHTLLESLRLSPSSFGLQPWKFLVITNQKIKESLKEHSWNQSQVTDCSHLIVHCARKDMPNEHIADYVQDIATTRNAPIETLDAYKQMMQNTVASRSPAEIAAWNARQVYISQGFLMLSAAMLRVDACPMEGFIAKKYDEILELEATPYTTTIVTPLGYRSSQDTYATNAKVRFAADKVIQWIS